jgi:hypothetical protein
MSDKNIFLPYIFLSAQDECLAVPLWLVVSCYQTARRSKTRARAEWRERVAFRVAVAATLDSLIGCHYEYCRLP